MKAIILGNSQAGNGATGQALAQRLPGAGYTVERKWLNGANTSAVASLAEDAKTQDPALVVLFVTNPDTQAIQNVIDRWPKAKLYVYGPPPATVIADLARAKAAFGGGVKSADHWFTDAKGSAPSTAVKREAWNDAWPAALPPGSVGNPPVYVDWRKIALPDALTMPNGVTTTQPNGVKFPNSKDGIHVTGKVADAATGAVLPFGDSVAVAQGVGLGLLAVLAGGWLLARWMRRS